MYTSYNAVLHLMQTCTESYSVKIDIPVNNNLCSTNIQIYTNIVHVHTYIHTYVHTYIVHAYIVHINTYTVRSLLSPQYSLTIASIPVFPFTLSSPSCLLISPAKCLDPYIESVLVHVSKASSPSKNIS